MATINFVPNDYIQQRQSSRANLMYLTLLAALLGGIGVTFSVIKMRQSVVGRELAAINAKMMEAKEQITQLEELKTKGKTMMKSMVMTAELLEPVPRSVVLACLTNNMPSGVSLLEMQLVEKENKVLAAPAAKSVAAAAPAKTTQYQSAAAKNQKAAAPETKTVLVSNLEIEGIAPSDIEVASFIASLSGSILLDSVELVQSKEQDIDGVKFRQFRLRTSLKSNLTLTKEDISKIRKKREEMI
ncbi:MAG TPA: PilN domain-containing protein [Anaerohalosphaeraceae bacterium]|nr:PilN domain-containing protein [Anaerohalosphaeraceae bacterium]